MLTLLYSLTLLWLGVCVWRSARRLSLTTGQFEPIDVVIIAHFFLCGLPIALDLLVGAPSFPDAPRLADAQDDTLTAVAFCLYVSLCPLIWFWFGKPRRHARLAPTELEVGQLRKPLQLACWCLAVLPVILVVISPEQDEYLSYGSAVRGAFAQDTSEWHNFIAMAGMVSVLAIAVVFSTLREIRPHFWAGGGLLILFDCWIHGKRAIVAIALISLGYTLWRRGILTGRRLKLAAIAGLGFLLAFSFFYQSNVRYAENPAQYSGVTTAYENFRGDFFRDDRIKLTLYAELHPDRLRILEYRGQSVLFNLLFFVPRNLWPDKPWPYAVYFTSAMLDMYPPRVLGWGMTTSWLEEAVANFGWLGVLLGPLSIAYACRWGSAYRWPPLTILTILVAVLLLAVQLSAFVAVFYFWLALLLLQLRAATRFPAPNRASRRSQ